VGGGGGGGERSEMVREVRYRERERNIRMFIMCE
jgi:hypothetical protein